MFLDLARAVAHPGSMTEAPGKANAHPLNELQSIQQAR